MSDTTEKAFDTFQGHFSFYRSIRADIDRIQTLVQQNPQFFAPHPFGRDCIKLAADKLTELVAAWKEQQ